MSDLKEYWSPILSRDTFTELGTYLSIAIPSYLMINLQFWILEALSFLAGLISVQYMSAQTSLYNIGTTMSQIPLGLMFTATAFVGNSIGMKQEKLAKFYAKISFMITFVIAIVLSGTIVIFATDLTDLYTTDEDVKPIIIDAMPYLSVYLLCIQL